MSPNALATSSRTENKFFVVACLGVVLHGARLRQRATPGGSSAPRLPFRHLVSALHHGDRPKSIVGCFVAHRPAAFGFAQSGCSPLSGGLPGLSLLSSAMLFKYRCPSTSHRRSTKANCQCFLFLHVLTISLFHSRLFGAHLLGMRNSFGAQWLGVNSGQKPV